MTDTERLNWLEAVTHEGACPGLVFDDNGHWAVAFEGTQNVPDGDGPQEIWTSFHVPPELWKPTIREAIDAAISNRKENA